MSATSSSAVLPTPLNFTSLDQIDFSCTQAASLAGNSTDGHQKEVYLLLPIADVLTKSKEIKISKFTFKSTSYKNRQWANTAVFQEFFLYAVEIPLGWYFTVICQDSSTINARAYSTGPQRPTQNKSCHRFQLTLHLCN